MGPWYVADIKDILHKSKAPDIPELTKAEQAMFQMLSDIEAAIVRMEQSRGKQDKE